MVMVHDGGGGGGRQVLMLLDEIEAIADSTTIIRDGRTIETLDMKADAVTEDRIIRAMVGRDLDSRFPERESHPGDEVLRIEDWTVGHPNQDRRVVDGATLNVRAGEVVGIAGLMGAGRTELAMSVFGRSYGRYLSGQVYKRGKAIQVRTVQEAIKHGLAYATEDRKKYGLNLIDDITRNVSGSALSKLANWGFVNRSEESTVAERFRKSMNIKAPTVAAVTGKLSGGNQQKVVLSKWMYADPDVLILDEPTRGIDVGAKAEIQEQVAALADTGVAVVFISSELEEVVRLSDRIVVLKDHRKIAELEAGPDVTAESIVAAIAEEGVSETPLATVTRTTPEEATR